MGHRRPSVKTSDLAFHQKRDLNTVSIIFDDQGLGGSGPISTYGAANNPTWRLINGLAEGEEEYERKGDDIDLFDLEYRICMQPNRSEASTDTYDIDDEVSRIILFYDNNAQGVQPALEDILRGYDLNGVATTHQMSPINGTTTSRFKILRDEWVLTPGFRSNNKIISGVGTHRIDPQQKLTIFEGVIPLSGLSSTYNNNNTTDITTISSGSLYLLVFGNTDGSYTTFKVGYKLYGSITLRFYP